MTDPEKPDIAQGQKFCDNVVAELKAMRDVGMYVPEAAIRGASNPEFMATYTNMKASECADLMIELCHDADSPWDK